MEIWNSFGSEHSADLVMIGSFKCAEDAQNVKDLFDKLADGLRDKIDFGSSTGEYSREVINLLNGLNCYSCSPYELEQFLYPSDIEVHDNKIVLKTEEIDVSVYFKLMILYGARVEIFSRRNFPGS